VNEVSYDIVIVGSGAGGGTVAQELAPLCKDGVRIAVLEKGPRLRDEEFTGREIEMAQILYDDAGGFLTSDGSMTLAMGRGYGGSTVVYTGTSLLAPERVIRRGASHQEAHESGQRPLSRRRPDQRQQPAVRSRVSPAGLPGGAVSGQRQGL
jgi:choline dehydrogenase-like flavoprotein